MLTKEDLAKYPFLKEAPHHIEKIGPTLEELETPGYLFIIQRAVERLKKSIDAKPIVPDWTDPDDEIFAYPLALAFVYGLKMPWLLERFAVSESKKCFELLKMESKEKLVEVAENGFGWKPEIVDMNVEGNRYDFKLDVGEYLKVAPQFYSKGWKLVNRYLVNGKVYLTHVEVAKLISRYVKNKIIKKATEEEIKRFEIPKVFSTFLSDVVKLAETRKQTYADEMPVEIVEEAKPPCIVAIINDLLAGKNLSHMERFTVTTFLLNIGESDDNILKIFSNVADFDEGKARYQIEHLAGRIGSKTKYNSPKCDVLKSFGICREDVANCGGVRNPLKYYRNKARELIKGTRKDRGGNKAV